MAAGGGGDRDVTFRFLADVGDAHEGIKTVETDVKKLGTEIKAVPAAASELDGAMKRAADAVARLSDPNISPKRLQTEVLKADIAVEQLTEAMKKAAATGGPTPPDMVARVQGFQTAVQGANARAAELRDKLADLKVKGDQAAQGFEKMAQFGGSAQSMMQGLADTSTGLGSSLAKAGLAVVGVFEALKVGLAIGNQVRDAWKEMTGKEMPNLTNWFVKLGTGVDNATGAFDRHGVAARSLIGIHNEDVRALNAVDATLDKLVPGLNVATAALKDSEKAAGLFGKAMDLMAKTGKDVTAYGKENADVILKALAPALKAGTISYDGMSAAMKVMIQAALSASELRKKEVEELNAAIGKIKEKAAATLKSAEADVIAAQKSSALAKEDVKSAKESIDAILQKRDAELKALYDENISHVEYLEKERAIIKAASDAEDAALKVLQQKVADEVVARGKAVEAIEKVKRAVDDEKKAVDDATTASKDQAKAWGDVNTASQKYVEKAPAVGAAADAVIKKNNEVIENLKATGGAFSTLESRWDVFLTSVSNKLIPGISGLISVIKALTTATKEAAGGGGLTSEGPK